jgi:hypothetical protein
MVTRLDELEFPGTSVDCSFSYGKALVLENALNFKGRPFNPTTVTELNYETPDNTLIFKLSKETESFGSRISGSQTRRKLENILILTQKNSVIIDASGVGLTSSSFSDEFFVKFILNNQDSSINIKIMNLNSVNYNILVRSYTMRAKKDPFEISSFFI